MTKNWLEFDGKILTTTNLKVGTWPKLHTGEPKSVNMTKNTAEFDRKLKI